MNLERSIDIDLLSDEVIENIFKKLDFNKYFVAVRRERIMIYYLGREFLTLTFSDGKWYFNLRALSIGEKNKKINEAYVGALRDMGYISGDFKSEIKFDSSLDYQGLIDETTLYLDRITCSDENVKKSEIASKYQGLFNDLICVDIEYILAFESKYEKSKRGIKGRYDLVFLRKCDDKFKIVFGELKSDKNACLDVATGIINHTFDMEDFLDKYRNSESIRKIISEGIECSLKLKERLGIIKEKIVIDMSEPQFIVLIDPVKKWRDFPINKEGVNKLILGEIEEARRIYRTYRVDGANKSKANSLDNILIGELGKKKYELSCEDEEYIKDIINKHDIYVVNKDKTFMKIN